MLAWKGALQYKDYRIYFLGQMVSISGSWMQQIAMSWLVYKLTGSVIMLTAITFLTQTPILVLGFWSGSFADKYDKRKALLLIQVVGLIHASLLCLLTKFNLIQGWHLLVFSLVLGISNACETPLKQVFIAGLIEDRTDLPNAIAINSLMLNSARVIGPSLAGIVLTMASEVSCFALNAVSYLAAVTAFMLIKTKTTPIASSLHSSSLGHFIEGYKVAMADPWIRRSLAMTVVVNMFAYPYSTLVPVFVQEHLHCGPDVYGVLIALNGAGALLAGLVMAIKSRSLCHKTLIAITAPLSGLAIFVFSSSTTVLLAEISIFCIGFFIVLGALTTNILIQGRINDAFRGRIMTLYAMTMLGVMPFGCLLLGYITKLLGLALALKTFACVVVVISSLLAVNMQKLLHRRKKSFIKTN